MRRIISVTILFLVVGLLGTTACKRFKIGSQDEGPIIVQNGSMTIDTDPAAQWQDDSAGAWKNVTGKDHKGELWVRVDLNDGRTCTGSGAPVHVEYTPGGFKAIFNVVGGGGSHPYTTVGPKGQLDPVSGQRLGHGKTGDGGYINGVKLKGTNDITITGTNDPCPIDKTTLKAVNICSSDTCK